jgi:hypothetical protein
MDYPWSNAEYRELTTKHASDAPAAPPIRTTADNASVEAYQAYQERIGVFPFPAAEIRSVYEINPDGSGGRYRTPPYVHLQSTTGLSARTSAAIRAARVSKRCFDTLANF